MLLLTITITYEKTVDFQGEKKSKLKIFSKISFVVSSSGENIRSLNFSWGLGFGTVAFSPIPTGENSCHLWRLKKNYQY